MIYKLTKNLISPHQKEASNKGQSRSIGSKRAGLLSTALVNLSDQ